MKNKFLLGLSVLFVFSTTHNVFGNEKIKELEQEESRLQTIVSENKKEKEALEEELINIQDNIEEIQKKIAEINLFITKNENQINSLNEKIKKTEKDIEETEEDIVLKTHELEKNKKQIEDNLRMIYSKSEVKFLEFLLRSESISQFIYRFEFMQDILKENEKLYNEVLKQVSYINQQKEKLKSNREQLTKEREQLIELNEKQLKERTNEENLRKALAKKEAELEIGIDYEAQTIKELMDSIALTQNEIETEKARIAEAKRLAEEARKQQSNSTNTKEVDLGSGQLASPMKTGTYRLTSGYGYRKHPVYGNSRFHNGIDMAAPVGTPIYASEEGYVIFSGPARGYGNWIVIKHPNGLHTIYGHMYSSGLKVSQGEYVFRGQHIANVGNAGTSTGAHLHFSLATSFKNGQFSYTNPITYFE